MSRLNQIQKNQAIKTIEKQKEQQQLKGGGLGNFYRMEEKNCPPPFELDGKHG